MTIRDILAETVRFTHPSIKTIKISGGASETCIQGCDDSRLLILEGMLESPEKQLQGEFGVTNLDLLKGLLALPAYKNGNASINIKRRDWEDSTTVESFEFRDTRGAGTDFRCMSPNRVPKQAASVPIPWDVSFKMPPEKITEFGAMANIFSSVDAKRKLFGVKMMGDDLAATFGSDHATTHRGSMILTENVTAKFKRDPLWSYADFMALLKIANGCDFTVRLSERGVLGVELQTPIGLFKYYLRSQQR